MWSVEIQHNRLALFTRHIVLVYIFNKQRGFNKFKQRDRISEKNNNKESNTMRERESLTGLERFDLWSSTKGCSEQQRRQG